jgi:hypothetical protein
LAIACYLVWKNSGLGSFTDLKNTILEARMVQDDLSSMLEKSVDISREIVMNIDSRIGQVNGEEQEKPILSPEKPTDANNFNLIPKTRIRIYELARILKMNSRDLIHWMQVAGYSYDNPLNTLDEATAGIIIDRIKYQGKEEQDDLIIKQVQPSVDIPLPENQTTHPSNISQINSEKSVDTADLDEDMEAWIESLKKAHPYMAVKALADQGYSIKDIAKNLDRGQGEVSLILNLLNKKRASM